MRYIAQWNYYSSLCEKYGTGPLAKGTPVNLEPAVAAMFNRDSPGVLKADLPKKRHIDEAPKTRHVKAAKKTRSVTRVTKDE